uniref:MAGUK p55 subfamily member 7-like n=1 Tax=Stegastes partitus TaxID=144197 RepID=A0A3B5B240_9TELE
MDFLPQLFVRALFDYDPSEDPTIPCQDAAVAFQRGDVLQILSTEDETWWQARRAEDSDSRAGLIPSKELGKKKETPVVFTVQSSSYDDVVLWFRDLRGRAVVFPFIPFVLIPGVGVNELKRRLLISDPDRYGVTVPYTTREKRRQESEGVDYHFVSVHMFEEHILDHRFIEYGSHGGHYYGTSLDSVYRVMAEGKVCLLDVHPSKIKRVYTSEFKPYVVFVKPPRIEELRLTRRRAKFVCDEEDADPVRVFSYGHLFDQVIVNGDIATAFREVRADLERIYEAEVQWVPADWTFFHSVP